MEYYPTSPNTTKTRANVRTRNTRAKHQHSAPALRAQWRHARLIQPENRSHQFQVFTSTSLRPSPGIDTSAHARKPRRTGGKCGASFGPPDRRQRVKAERKRKRGSYACVPVAGVALRTSATGQAGSACTTPTLPRLVSPEDAAAVRAGSYVPDSPASRLHRPLAEASMEVVRPSSHWPLPSVRYLCAQHQCTATETMEKATEVPYIPPRGRGGGV